ncbi:hypothetical protein CERSUDRAFT_75059 [Gelatoporia subvermispora B]|uniref:DUF6570 domain-containing protein n=1 Tax=Ceriporiopsis subvermispora (strain B) TaxID=914234 RepID=M2QTS5_CERS8|nr:hypothetical protein CERSUDRAFT_75059 [Gelatoporia subvermispora B]
MSVLASLISVTFVGSGKLPRNWLKKTFRVRQKRIGDALAWLHTNNSRYYGDIVISEERLALLPEDDIPDAVESIVRHCKDEAVLDREHGGYVPSEDCPLGEACQSEGRSSDVAPDEAATVIPLHVSGSVDVDLSRMTSAEIMQKCLKYDKKGGLRCKRRAPFEVSDKDYILESGKWAPKRLYEYVNTWNPAVLINARCNNDIKLLTNGEETHSITFYIGAYALKKQQPTSSLSAIVADGYSYHTAHMKPEYVHKVREQQRLLLFRLVNTVNREQELAGPMVVSYLMGWGDVKRSHIYTPLYWSSFTGALCCEFPELRNLARLRHDAAVRATTMREAELPEQQEARPVEEQEVAVVTEVAPLDQQDLADSFEAEDGNERVTLEIDQSGRLTTGSQATDYRLRGHALNDMNVALQKSLLMARGDEGGQQTNVSLISRDTLSRWFPWRDDPNTYDYYCASMLVLLKPWRNIKTDLKGCEQTWASVFSAFEENCSDDVKFILAGIQYYHQCSVAATADQECENGSQRGRQAWNPQAELEDIDEADDGMDEIQEVLTEESLKLLKRQQSWWESSMTRRTAGRFDPVTCSEMPRGKT